ncbi:hypothetical protein [Patulibacter sp.]|uniref:hypothetical protein n=1 Tax=Patulibacter sp. TaxID=1912859 RepID=UPI0027194D57|nr:hypothetical protein [Patulibacter sp.]MDO9409779.1 hypothetical protein [Patulibacter sp.]
MPPIALPHLPQLPQLLPRVEAALDAVVALERALRTLPAAIEGLRRDLGVLTEVRDDMKGMRQDIKGVISAVDDLKVEIGRLPPDVTHLRGAVDAMYASVDRMEDQVEGMSGSLQQIDRIAGRVVHPLRRRTRGGRDAEGPAAAVVVESLDDERLIGRGTADQPD